MSTRKTKGENKMATVDNSKIFHEGTYSDVTIKVPAQTTYQAGTVLGRNKDGDLVAFSTDNNVAASPGPEFNTSPLYILAQSIENKDGSNAEEFDLVRVFESGVVDAAKLIFIKTADATDIEVLDALKTNGFRLRNVEELTIKTSLSE